MTTNFDIIIIGAGPSGYSCGIALAKRGKSVLIIERDLVGGVCVQWGCTPSKAMIYSSKIVKYIKEAEKYGIEIPGYSVNFDKIIDRRSDVISMIQHKIEAAIEASGANIIQGEAEIVGRNSDNLYQVLVKKGSFDMINEKMVPTGEEIIYTAKHIVISTGSQPVIPPFINKDDKSIISSNKLITIKELPENLTIVGGGFIGMEFATIFNQLGTKVTVIEYCDRVLSWCDPEISSFINENQKIEGVNIITGAKVLGINAGILSYVEMKNGVEGEKKQIKSPLNLISVGRKPVLNEVLWQKLGLRFTPRGIEINEYLQTNLENVWAIGDATGKSILAHVGIKQGVICADNILAFENNSEMETIDYSVVPAVVYTLPEISMVGTIPKEMGDKFRAVKLGFENNLRAEIEGNEMGFIKIWIENALGTIVAAQVVGYAASEMVQTLSNIIKFKTTVGEIAGEIHAHPTYSEIIKTVCEVAIGRAIEVLD